MKGRDCLLERDYAQNPIPYSFKVRNNPEVRGLITSNDGLFEAISKALEVYQTDDINIALRRIGKGLCPKSFPITPQSIYFLDLYHRTHGGEYGVELTHLPCSGGVEEQPSIFYSACDVIGRVKSSYLHRRMSDGKTDDSIHRETDPRAGDKGPPKSSFGR